MPEMVLAWCVAAVALTGCRDAGGGAGDGAAGTGGSSSGGAASGSSGAASESGSGGSSGGDVADQGPWDTFDQRPCPEDSFLTYENFGWPHMLTYCTGCHSSDLPADMRQGAPIEINFMSVQDIRDKADRIWLRAADQHATMPPVGPAPDEERALLGEWLACGARTDADLGG